MNITRKSYTNGGAEKELFFPVTEFKDRLSAVRAEMSKRGLDALLVNTPENILYLTGYQTPGYYMYQCVLVTMKHDPVLLIRNGEFGNFLTFSWLDECATYFDDEDPVETTLNTIAEYGVTGGNIGVEMRSWFLTPYAFQQLEKRNSNLKWTDASGTVEACRLRKSAREVEFIRAAAKAAEAGMRAAIDAVDVGKTDRDVSAALHAAMISAGSEYPGMGPFVAVGKRSAMMHGIWGGYPIEAGQTINLEIGASVHRYGGCLMRSVSVGKPSAEVEKIAVAVESANRRLIEGVRPGAMTADLHGAVGDELASHGFDQNRKGRRCGYSLGLAFPPDWGEGHILSVIDKPNVKLEPGMVLHLPLSLRIFPRVASAFSETVLVTEKGHEVLTNFDRRLFVRNGAN
ncbi:MAG: M24 family metallopeptidase [Vulcanimicrobiaceae bacterium]